MDLTTHKATIERAGDEVEKYCGKQADGKPLLRCLVELLKRSREGAVREEKKACLLALQALKILKHGCHAIPYTGDYHLERLIASLLRRMQDCKEFDKDGSTILETATLGLQACESTARNKFKKITMTPSGLPQQFTVLVNNLLSARSKVLSELTEELYEEITGKNSNNSNPILNAILPASYIRAWKSNLQTIVDTKTWVDHHWQQDKSQALYYRVTLARAFMTLGKCSPSCDDAVRPIHEGIQQITLLGSGRFRNVGFAANTAQCLFVNAYTLLRMRQDLIFSNLQRYSSPTSPFNCLKEVTDDHFCCFADIVSAEEISSLPKQIYTYTVLAFACWDVIVGSGVALSPSAEKNIDYLSKAMLYQGDEKLHLWGSNLLHLNCDEAKSSVVLQIASTLVENGVKEAAKRWINKIENKSDKLLSIQKQLLHPDTNNDSVVESLQRLVDLHIPPESDLIFYEAELSGRIILSQRALLYGCSEASVAAGEHHLAAFFRTDPLILADNRKQSTSIIHKVFTLLHSHTEALITRGEHAILVKLLSQAVKVQGCNGGSFSARHTAIILSRVGEARAATHCHGEALRFYASAKLLLNKLLDDGSSLDLKLRIAMLTVDSQLAMGQTADAISELDHVEKTLLQMVIPSRVSQATSEPWKYLLSNVKLSPIEFISESSSDFSSKYDGLRALLHAKKSMCLSSTSWKSTLAQAIPNLINPRDAAHARVALATLDVNLRKDQNVQWFKTSADIDTEKKILEKALDTGSSKGPMQSTKTIALELVKRYGTSHQLHSAHYLNVSQGWTTRHQYHGLGTRRSIGVYDFTGDWFAEQGRLDSHLTDPDSYIERLQAFLPPSFAVVTLSIGSNGHLLIGRVESGVPPLCIGIADCENSLKESNATLNSILSRAKEHVTAVDTSQIDSLKYKQQWWNQRVEFDKEIKNCIGNLGDNILGVWRGLLLGQPLNPDIKNKLNDITQYTVTQLREILPQNHCVDSRMVALLISSAPHLHEGLLNDAVKRKGGFWRETTHMIYEGLQDVVADESLLTPEVKSKIKSIARTVHEKVYAVIPTGKRCNRQHTLMVLGSLHCFPWEATSALEGEPASRIPSLDYVMQKLESESLSDILCRPIDKSKTFYVLNPDGNLKKTEAKFDWFAKREGWKGQMGCLPGTVQNGAGVGSHAPTNPEGEKQWRERWLKIFTYGLMRTDVFLFLGHGTGDQFVSMKDVRSIGYTPGTGIATPMFSQPPPLSPALPTPRKLFDDPSSGIDFNNRRSNSPISRRRRSASTTLSTKRSICLLMGCSSGKLSEAAGEFESDGMPFSFLLAGAPAVLANLWDVTDGEIDRFTDRLLKTWLDKEPSNVPFTTAVNSSRDSVKLRYLIGACPVVYGMPINPSLE